MFDLERRGWVELGTVDKRDNRENVLKIFPTFSKKKKKKMILFFKLDV